MKIEQQPPVKKIWGCLVTELICFHIWWLTISSFSNQLAQQPQPLGDHPATGPSNRLVKVCKWRPPKCCNRFESTCNDEHSTSVTCLFATWFSCLPTHWIHGWISTWKQVYARAFVILLLYRRCQSSWRNFWISLLNLWGSNWTTNFCGLIAFYCQLDPIQFQTNSRLIPSHGHYRIRIELYGHHTCISTG